MVPGSSAALATIGTAEVANARAPDMNVLKRTLRNARREMCILSPPKTCPERARYRSDDVNRSGYLPPPLATGCDRTPRPGLGAQTNDVLQLVPCSNLPCPREAPPIGALLLVQDHARSLRLTQGEISPRVVRTCLAFLGPKRLSPPECLRYPLGDRDFR